MAWTPPLATKSLAACGSGVPVLHGFAYPHARGRRRVSQHDPMRQVRRVWGRATHERIAQCHLLHAERKAAETWRQIPCLFRCVRHEKASLPQTVVAVLDSDVLRREQLGAHPL
eukprot:TRINITY_DN58277_c0_g1_i1.p4 TRINITY_DN58277_c0_g1~~TRINITY_DN58277_c0_g1_i1.p4  ORF type:complete len:114 (-),score=14.21 TRINITY_DN58277_c0_g1_i1:287-628(-)